MTNKWRWIFLMWHSWRAAVWRAEALLYTDCPARRRIESLCDYHYYSARELHRELFPPPPFDLEEAVRAFRKTRG